MTEYKLNIAKLSNNINEALKNKDYEKLKELHLLINDELVKVDKFHCYMAPINDEVTMKINKNGTEIELSEVELKEIFENLSLADSFDWKLPF